MPRKLEISKLEKRAKAYLLNKEISRGKMEAVKALMNNSRIDNYEKYNAILELLKNCPDKRVKDKVSLKPSPQKMKKKNSGLSGDASATADVITGPTETSLFIDELYYKYRHLKLFRKRYLVHRNNKVGIGLRKRLIPSHRLIRVMKKVGEEQDALLARIIAVLADILRDESIQDPTVFNYLRIVRKWMMDTPLVKYDYAAIKWMERPNFEKEFSSYLSWYFSFLGMDAHERERIMILLEIKLRQMDDLKKEEAPEKESDGERRLREKVNLAREGELHRIMSLARSFLPASFSEENRLTEVLIEGYSLNGLSDLLMITAEVLVFQRPIVPRELTEYLNIRPPVVSSEKWEYHEETLKKFGKDPASKKRKEIDRLRKELLPYEETVRLLKIEEGGRNLLMNGAESQMLLMDNRHQDPADVLESDFFTFIDAVIRFFKNSYLPVLDGTKIIFRDGDRNEHESSILDPEFLRDEMAMLNLILEDMHFFRGNNPNLAIGRMEMKKIMNKQMATMAKVEEYVRGLGNFFYTTAKKLHGIYDLHTAWIRSRVPLADKMMIRDPLKTSDAAGADRETGRPLPFFDCTIKDFYRNNVLTRKLAGKKITGPQPDDGIFILIIAYLYQAASECFNEHLEAEIDERKKIIRKIDELNR